MFNKIFSIFSKKEQIIAVDVEKEAVAEPLPIPDILEISWKECAAVKNYEDAITKTHNDLKDFLYNVKMKEISIIRAIEKLEKASDKKIEDIKEKYLKEQSPQFEFTVPAATGKPGFLKKKKTK